MVKETTCEINFNPIDSVGAVYYSGQQISGNVLFTFYEKQSVKGRRFFYSKYIHVN